ncbi:ATP-dependent DNA helicase RecG [Pilibacter termitis]|uniref:ATP-dependent DNA helicase RecG n=1 Tax=Pilibacter termitis TaxID=263852 RepID=A0A1T4QAF6_9ENTE|nr:ATP-dependent DNA helicase RecG [Pilibacter termitis]SKA00511.1 ATP-dependent DNA helicase RecG [Pilibacter termitis]
MDIIAPVLHNVRGIGEKKSDALATLGIVTVQDLLFHFPFRYDDLSEKNLAELLDGEKTTLKGIVATEAVVSFYGKRNRLLFRMMVGDAVIAVTFFNQHYLKNRVQVGEEIAVYGKWDANKQTILGMKLLSSGGDEKEFSPIYHVNKSVKQNELVKFIKSAIDTGYLSVLPENLPLYLREKYRLIDRSSAVRAMHFPENEKEHTGAKRRLKFEEFFYFQMRIQALRFQEKVMSQGQSVMYDEKCVRNFIEHLPFELTNAQRRVTSEILNDMKSTSHMLRLLQGDVGSGKTVIAAIAMLAAATNNKQSALMVPTEILATQHLESLKSLLSEQKEVKIALLTGSTKAKERREILNELASGEIDIVVGTHALIQEGVDFHDLGLVITDEQHRFGVNQRKILREKGNNPDILFMTATPIPRTLAITAFGEMDVSIIDEMPAGRIPILTKWIKHEQLETVLQWLNTEIVKGHQIYVISPLIEESEVMDLKNATDLAEELQSFFADTARVALLHGRMKNEEKDDIMRRFKEREMDILVSTTVIEVGVNVPNATVMMIMDADRFGLAQLHQLRGRVGRGDLKSYCILVANPKSEDGKKRMKIMTETNNGFVLSEKDLELRGSGEVFGTKQSGLPNFLVADMVADFNILEVAREEASRVWQVENWWEKPQYKLLADDWANGRTQAFD